MNKSAVAEAGLTADDRTLSRFFGKVAVASDMGACWLWTGARISTGYGRFAALGHPIAAHRAAYILAIGPIPSGLQIDHLCRVRSCANPTHLEPVTQKVNMMRGDSPSARNAVKTHCKRGHAFDATNTGMQQSGRHKGRLCLACKAEGWYRRG